MKIKKPNKHMERLMLGSLGIGAAVSSHTALKNIHHDRSKLKTIAGIRKYNDKENKLIASASYKKGLHDGEAKEAALESVYTSAFTKALNDLGYHE